MHREAFSSALDGGYVRAYSLDFLSKAFEMQVDVLDNGVLSTYDVLFSGITFFEFSDAHSNRWERIELTEVRLEEPPEGSRTEEWKVWLNFWDAAEVSLRCAVIRVDGAVLT